MSKRSKRLLSLLLGAGLVLSTPAALAWSWNQYQPRPYNGFESYSPGYGSSGYGYQPVYPRSHRGAYRPRYYGYGHGRYHQRPRYGHYRYFPSYRYSPGCRY